MTKQAITAAPEASIRDVARLMSEIDAGVIPMIDGANLRMVMDRDIAIRAVAEGVDPSPPISDIMTAEIESRLDSDERREAVPRMSDLQNLQPGRRSRSKTSPCSLEAMRTFNIPIRHAVSLNGPQKKGPCLSAGDRFYCHAGEIE